MYVAIDQTEMQKLGRCSEVESVRISYIVLFESQSQRLSSHNSRAGTEKVHFATESLFSSRLRYQIQPKNHTIKIAMRRTRVYASIEEQSKVGQNHSPDRQLLFNIEKILPDHVIATLEGAQNSASFAQGNTFTTKDNFDVSNTDITGKLNLNSVKRGQLVLPRSLTLNTNHRYFSKRARYHHAHEGVPLRHLLAFGIEFR